MGEDIPHNFSALSYPTTQFHAGQPSIFEKFIHFIKGIGTNGDIFKLVLRLDFLREEMGKVITEDLR